MKTFEWHVPEAARTHFDGFKIKTALETCNPLMIVTYEGFGSHRYYHIRRRTDGAILAHNCTTIRQARKLAGALSGMVKDWNCAPYFSNRKMAETAFGKLVTWYISLRHCDDLRRNVYDYLG